MTSGTGLILTLANLSLSDWWLASPAPTFQPTRRASFFCAPPTSAGGTGNLPVPPGHWLDGMGTRSAQSFTRVTHIADKSVKSDKKARAKADPNDPLQAGAPIPGIITSVNVSVGTKVAKGDKLMTMEAMKMQMTIYAGTDGVVAEIYAQVRESVERKDLPAKLRV